MKKEFEDPHEHLSGTHAVEKIRALAKAAHVCLFGTVLTRPPIAVRPMAVQSVDDAGNLWFLSARSSSTNRDIQGSAEVQLFFANPGSAEFMTLDGTATISDDPALRREHWTPIAKTWFNQGVDDPEVTVIKVEPSDGYYWDTKHGKTVAFLKIAAGAVTGQTFDDSVEGKIRP
jgi:general stress protein 26